MWLCSAVFLVNTAKWVAANPRTNPTRSRKDSMVSVSSRLLRHLHSPSNMVFDEASAAITSRSVCSCFAGLVPTISRRRWRGTEVSSGVGIGQPLGANRFELLTDIGGERFAESQSTRCDTARILFHGSHVGAYEAEPVCEEGVFDDVHAAARALRFFTERHSLSDKAEVIECLQVQVNIAVLDSGMLRDYLGRRFAVCNGLHHRKIDCRLAQLLAQQHHRFLVQCAEFVEAEVDDVGLVAGRFVKLAQIIWHAAKGSVIVYLLNRRGVRQEFRDFQIVEWLQPDLRGASAE